MVENLVFVYGTLRKGGSLHRIMIDGLAVFVGNGLTVNKYHMTASGCPFVHPDISTVRIVGEVYKVNLRLLNRLDEVEGFHGRKENSNYYREVINVELENGEGVVQAGIYFNEHACAALAIPSGDFKDFKKYECLALRNEVLLRLKGLQATLKDQRSMYVRRDALSIFDDVIKVVSVSGILTSVFIYDGFLYSVEGSMVTCVKRVPKRLRIKLT